MRKTSKHLAIIASVFSLLRLVFIILFLVEFLSTQNNAGLDPTRLTIVLITIFITAAEGIMGLIAALIVAKKHTAAGIMMIICAMFCLINMLIAFTVLHIVSTTLFIIGSVFALKRERTAANPPQPNGLPATQPARKPGKVLGIIGGASALVIAILIVITNIGYISVNPRSYENSNISEAMNIFLFMVPAIVNFLVGVLGLTAALIINKRHTAAGVMMIIGAVICVFGFMNIISMVLLIIGSVFALRPDRPVPAPAQAPPPEQLPQEPVQL